MIKLAFCSILLVGVIVGTIFGIQWLFKVVMKENPAIPENNIDKIIQDFEDKISDAYERAQAGEKKAEEELAQYKKDLAKVYELKNKTETTKK